MGWGWYGYDSGDYYEDTDTLADYETPSEAIIVPGPVRAESRRGDIGREWWGRQWVQALEHLGLTGRLDRGKRYARNGSVQRLEISPGMVYAEVRGSQRNPYRTAIQLLRISDADWQKAFEALAEQAIYAAKLLAGEMPGDIEALFQHAKLSLFPKKRTDIEFICSCPDWGNPCKHAAAVYYLVAEQLDADPFILFHLRGRSREALMAALRGYGTPLDEAEEAATPNPPLDVTTFWEGSEIMLVREAPVRVEESVALKQFGRPPGGIERELKTLYKAISEEALRWLGIE